jgi:hypothetical protein
MKTEINGKFYEFSDDEQLYRFFHALSSKMKGTAQVVKDDSVYRLLLPGSLFGVYNVMAIIENLTTENRKRLGFTVEVIITRSADTAPANIRISIRPPSDSWLHSMDREDADLNHIVNYYTTKVKIDEDRADTLARIRD